MKENIVSVNNLSVSFDYQENFISKKQKIRAVNNINILDTINKSITSGHYAEIYRNIDSMFIQKRALISSFKETDTTYIHGEKIIVTGKEGEKIIRAFENGTILRGNIKFPFSLSNKERKKLKFENINERFFSAYFRFEVLDKPGVLSNITNIFSKNKDFLSASEMIVDIIKNKQKTLIFGDYDVCLLYTSPSPRDRTRSRMPSSA